MGLFEFSVYPLTSTNASGRRTSTGRIRVPAIVLALTILALFTSTTIYLVYTILMVKSSILNDLLFSPNLLWSLPYGSLELPKTPFKDYTLDQQCAGTLALTINVGVLSSSPCARLSVAHLPRLQILLGDAIVCWRACVLWHRSRLVKGVCIAFLLTTFGKQVTSRVFSYSHVTLRPVA